eukprot:TRINITY_DN1865_c0_g1_i1.p2 TRINITY_DN1865_c0_g1~~TRINITY_DN1865_c0_g1_i1.p2  ORF type:complete len:124 (+),score=29.90 TRINITY_DN1865_c0_g1_i1:394-765(+)
MRPNTPKRIHPRTLLLTPKLSPVPSVLILSSTKANAGLDAVTAHTAAVSDAPMPTFLLVLHVEGFSSEEQLTLPFLAIAGKPRAGAEETPTAFLSTGVEPAMDEVGALAVMVAIFFQYAERRR